MVASDASVGQQYGMAKHDQIHAYKYVQLMKI